MINDDVALMQVRPLVHWIHKDIHVSGHYVTPLGRVIIPDVYRYVYAIDTDPLTGMSTLPLQVLAASP